MKRSLAAIAACAMLVAVVAASSVEAASRPPNLMYGHIKSLTAKGRSFELRFDPAWWLTGPAAARAKLEDTGSSDVPNDYYIVEEGHRLLRYPVARTAHVTVLSKGLRETSITVAELTQILKGKNPRHRALFDRQNALGFWIRIGPRGSSVVSIDQQYQP